MAGKATGTTPLHLAALKNDVQAARELLAAGADPNSADQDGFTPLHFAAQEYAVAAVAALLDAGADVDATNKFGNTPLWVAVFNSRGRGQVIEILRKHGANPHRKNNSNRTPVDLARLIANYDVIQYFADLA